MPNVAWRAVAKAADAVAPLLAAMPGCGDSARGRCDTALARINGARYGSGPNLPRVPHAPTARSRHHHRPAVGVQRLHDLSFMFKIYMLVFIYPLSIRFSGDRPSAARPRWSGSWGVVRCRRDPDRASWRPSRFRWPDRSPTPGHSPRRPRPAAKPRPVQIEELAGQPLRKPRHARLGGHHWSSAQ